MGLMYTSIRVKDMNESVRFYTKEMGLKVVGKRSPIPGEEVVSLADKATDQRINLMWYSKSCRLYTPWKQDGVELDHLMFQVKDARKLYGKLVKKGMKPAMELWERENKGKKMTMGFIKDPNGIWVGLRSEGRKK
jgi:catechol 2,3-dioxygenase-like lactoylglutathione lyase family enzyme